MIGTTIAHGRTDVWLMDADGSNQRQVGSTGPGAHFVHWTKDGCSAIYRWILEGVGK